MNPIPNEPVENSIPLFKFFTGCPAKSELSFQNSLNHCQTKHRSDLKPHNMQDKYILYLK